MARPTVLPVEEKVRVVLAMLAARSEPARRDGGHRGRHRKAERLTEPNLCQLLDAGQVEIELPSIEVAKLGLLGPFAACLRRQA